MLKLAISRADLYKQLELARPSAGYEQGLSLLVILGLIIKIILGFAGTAALIAIIYSGWLWMTARGDEENVKKAKTLLKNSIIGLVIVLCSYVIAVSIPIIARYITGGIQGGYKFEPPPEAPPPYSGPGTVIHDWLKSNDLAE